MSTNPRRLLNWPPFVDRIASIVDPERSFLVGGCVRNALCGRPVSDVDLVTFDDGRDVAKEIANRLAGAYFPLDVERRIGRAILDLNGRKLHIDASSLRDTDLERDLRKRDFTINATAVSLTDLNAVIDPLNGTQDILVTKTLRQCGLESINDDPVRALRAVRFSLDFGLRIEPETLLAVREGGRLLADDRGQLNQPERVRDELFKLLALNKPGPAIRILDQLALGDFVFGPSKAVEPALSTYRVEVTQSLANIFSIIRSTRTDDTAAEVALGVAVMTLDAVRAELQSHLSHVHADERSHHSLLLMGTYTVGQFDAREVGSRFRLSNIETGVLESLRGSALDDLVKLPITDRLIHRFFKVVGSAGIDIILLWLAEFLAASKFEIDLDEWGWRLNHIARPLLNGYFFRFSEVIQPTPLISGDRLQIEVGMRPGPKLGRILSQLLEEQAAGEIRTEAEALALAQKLVETVEE